MYLSSKINKDLTSIIGTYECKVEAKGRLVLPTALKKQLIKVLDGGFILKKGVFDKCLEFYPRAEWDKEAEKVAKLNPFVKKNKVFIRKFMDGVRELDLDANGRMQIPIDLFKYAELKKEVVLTSGMNVIEIWDKDKYNEILNDDSVDFGELAEDVMGNNTGLDNE